ncbi:MAG TPA: prepilin-type N-terminal cleavage/methylation domain-containing protein [Chthoniobacteraceae bacterium]|nr:prepilin-type N-terminal cleavage/methylation domain-containing protein [Chthoniobacteraceae bacterium]
MMSAFPSTKSGCRGFSLTELLVVIVAGSILIALLIPAGLNALESSRMVSCTQKLKQLGADVLRMAGENNGELPWYEGRKGTKGMWWYRLYEPVQFAGFNERMTCPSSKTPYIFRYNAKVKELTGTYRYNKYLGYQHHSTGEWIYPLQRLPSIGQPSRVPMLADFKGTLAAGADDSTGFETWPQVIASHRNGTVGHVLCVDGHAEAITSKPDHLSLNPRNLK